MLVRQRVISAKNIGMAMEWAGSEDEEVAQLASIVADIGRKHPSRKRRLPFLRYRHPELWTRMLAAGVVDDLVEERPEYEAEIEHLEHEGAYTSSDEATDGIKPTAAEAEDHDAEEEIPF